VVTILIAAAKAVCVMQLAIPVANGASIGPFLFVFLEASTLPAGPRLAHGITAIAAVADHVTRALH
jgi:hypothetical protein